MNGFASHKAQQSFPTNRALYTDSISNLSTATPGVSNRSEANGIKTSSSSSKSCAVKTHSRGKKSTKAEEVAVRKRQEFDELVKARTDKLLSDGPVYTVSCARDFSCFSLTFEVRLSKNS